MASNPISLWFDPQSQPSRSVLILLGCLNVPFEKNVVQVGKGETRSPAYKKINPFGVVPFIHDGDFKLGEGPAILSYIAETRGSGSNFYPACPKARARIQSAMSWHEMNLRIGSMNTVFQLALVPMRGGTPNSEILKSFALPLLKTSLQNLKDVLLKDSPFVAGDDVTIADLLIACEVDMLRILVNPSFPTWETLVEANPKLVAYLDRVRAATAPHYDANLEGILKLRGFLRKKSGRPNL